MMHTIKIGLSILALAAACSAHPGHDKQTFGVFWKQPGKAHEDAGAKGQIWRFAFVSVYQWSGSR